MFICMLAYYVEWHMREKLKIPCCSPTATKSRQRRLANRRPTSVQDLPETQDATRRTSDDFPVQSFHDILQDLAGTLCRSRIRIPEFDSEFDKLTLATPYQQHVLDLLGVTAN
ncbi:MAG: hypothetical protein R3C28_11690 [Pirellulaceae bacterium]